MKNFYTAFTVLLVFAFACVIKAGGKNIVPNPGFEELDGGNPAAWNKVQKNWIIDTKTAHSGKNSLRITNDDPESYTLMGCTIVPERGESYDISAWVKLQNVTGDGASFIVEYWGEAGKYMGGTWDSPTLCGTADWQKLVFKNRIMPKDESIKRITMTVFLSRKSTGTVWFDDIEISQSKPAVFETFLLYPNYRGWILPVNKKKEIEVDISIDAAELKQSLENLEIYALLRESRRGSMAAKDSKVVGKKIWSSISSEESVFRMDSSDLPCGNYELDIHLRDKEENKVIDVDTYRLKKFSEEEFGKLKTYFDENNVFYVGGKPYFPLGWYTCPEWNEGEGYVKYCNPEEITSDAPFNTVIFYGPLWQQMLDGINKYGIKILGGGPIGPFNHGGKRSNPAVRHGEEMEIKNFILKFKDHPAILGWYINDEVPTDDTCYPTLVDHYEWISETDPDHPTYTVQMNLGDLGKGAFVTDIIGVDPYPIGVRDLTWVCDMTETAVKVGYGTRPVWTVVQALMRGVPLDQGRCVSYLAIISGAKGLFYYSFFDMKTSQAQPDFKDRLNQQKVIAREIAALSPAILSAEETGAKVICNDKDIRSLLKKYNGMYYLITANSKGQKKNPEFKSEGMDIETISNFFDKNQSIPSRDNSFSREYEPYGTFTYIIKAK